MSVASEALILRNSLLSLLVGGQLLCLAQVARSQVLPDTTNPVGTVIDNVGEDFVVREGSRAGNNLFHRFSQFDLLDADVTVTFQTFPDIQNIFSQVVGNAPSTINGEILIAQPANLFLINPSGIVFGPDATLNIQGSFIASTADTILFEGSDTFFDATTPSGELLNLTMAPEALLFSTAASQTEPFAITSRGNLAVPNGENLIFAGGTAFPTVVFAGGVQLAGSTLEALGGRIELAAMQGPDSRVNLDIVDGKPRIISVEGPLADMRLDAASSANVRSIDNGDITLFAQNLSIREGSQLIAGIAPIPGSDPDSRAGDIRITASGVITLSGLTTFFERSSIINAQGINEDSEAQGRSGDIFIEAQELRVSEGGQIFASTFEDGDAGEIYIEADAVSFTGGVVIEDQFAPSQAFNRAELGALGNAGLIQITTDLLSLSGGGQVSTSTRSEGNAGVVKVIAPGGQIIIDGFADIGSDRSQSGIFSTVTAEATGNGREVTLQAQEIRLSNGGAINTSTAGGGFAGDITITETGLVALTGTAGAPFQTAIQADTESGQAGGTISLGVNQLLVQNGAQVSAISFNTGLAGTLNLSAAEFVNVVGSGSEISFDSRNDGEDGGDAGNLLITVPRLELLAGGQVSARTAGGGAAGILSIQNADTITIDGFDSGIFLNTEGSGDARGIDIQTRVLTVQNGGQITVNGTQSGSPGNLVITADQIYLNNQGKLTTSTVSETGGSINPLRVGTLLFMTDGSEITASALGGGDGGNIEIIAPNGFILSRSIFEDNDIIATAESTGTGGVAIATALLVEGFVETRGGDTLGISNFSASSAVGTDGTTRIDAEPSIFEEIPLNFADARIAQSCRLGRRAEQSEFVVTGRGGVPPTPGEGLTIGAPEVGLVTVEEDGATAAVQSEATQSLEDLENPSRTEIIEPQGWAYNAAGQLVLVAEAPPAIAPPPSLLNCYVLSGDR